MRNYFREYCKMLRFAASSKTLFILAAVCMGVSTLFGGASLGMIIPLADRVLTNKKIVIPAQLPAFLASFIEKFNSLDPAVLLKVMAAVMIFLFLFKGIAFFLQTYLMNVVGQKIIKEVRSKIYHKFQDLSLEFYGRKRAGELMSRVTNDVGIITNAVSMGLADFIYNGMQAMFFAVASVWLAFVISWKLPIIIFVIFPLIMYPVLMIGKRVKKLSTEVQERIADLNSLLSETIQGAYIVKVFCREDYELGRFNNINQNYYKATLKSAKRTLALSPLTEFIGAIGAVVVLMIVGGEVIAGRLSFGVFGTFLAFLLSLIRPLKKISSVHAVNQQAFAASERVYSILDEEIKVKEKEGAKLITSFDSYINFEKVSFRYEEDFVLQDINLSVKKGEIIALVGHSGAGKSTLVSLLPRLYDPVQGKVLIDGVNIDEFKIKSLRNLIAVVSQELVLFNTTVRENIGYGKEGAVDQEIFEASKNAYAYDFIQSLPAGFSTVIGDRGVKLSGGQRQRLSIARAILKDAPILILDEATSQLDSESEQLIQDAFNNLMKGKTVFIIAHRLSTVQKANRIVVLDNGRIVEVGTHTSLLEGNAVYKKLYDLQFKG